VPAASKAGTDRRSKVTTKSTESAEAPLRIGKHDGSRDDLRELFELAEDSALQLNSYLDEGEVYVAEAAGEGIIGELQLISLSPAYGEIKNMAVTPPYQRLGVGTALVRHAIGISHDKGWNQLFVRTATADTGNLHFYQRLGFRCVAVEPDAFTPASDYPNDLLIDGIPLRDAIVLCLALVESGQPPTPISGAALKVRVARQSRDLETVVAFTATGWGAGDRAVHRPCGLRRRTAGPARNPCPPGVHGHTGHITTLDPEGFRVVLVSA
jgi:GNAT superfamily N-acetyltransferase